MALARAIARRSKLLICLMILWFEASCPPNSLLITSVIDCETDAVIQNSLRPNPGSGVTPLTIAHGLQIVMDAIVIDGGNIVEFDTRSELLQTKDGEPKATAHAR